ncbi:hypothetical protein LX70_02682 [Defluviimonas denitrificans]|jgi:hypothetical protein|uniref:Uncharacterized protein n=1 Tax=Albidovulum denitrificans TaxID=404881 RepID=A0A2S8S6J5_9RHOB|nr:hypothetical protein [Defluviimonas denitrificans]PQV56416.1 hypothetical protein LX70_02682 [Defluviimonas denitrificans]
MIVFYDPTPVSTNPDRYRILWTAKGDRDDLTEGKANWIEVADQALETLDGWVVEGGALVLADLTAYRREAIARINEAAGQTRLQFITDIPGQQMLYQAKEQEAAAYLAESPAPVDLSNYPLMAAEVGAGLTALTPLDLAQTWLAMANQWRLVAAAIENVRLLHVYAVEQAADLATIDQYVAQALSLLASIVTPQP